MNTIPELRQLEKTRKKLEVYVVTHMETITNSPPSPLPTRKTRNFPIYAYYTRITSTRKDSKKLEVYVVTHYEGDIILIGKSYRLKIKVDTNLFLAKRTAIW